MTTVIYKNSTYESEWCIPGNNTATIYKAPGETALSARWWFFFDSLSPFSTYTVPGKSYHYFDRKRLIMRRMIKEGDL